MGDFGAELRHAREERGVSLRQISTATKISMSVLEALERNDFSRLPGGIFSRAFVRAFAVEVGLDPEDAVRDFLVEFEQSEQDRITSAPRPEVTADDREFLERQRRAARALRAALIALLLLIAGAVLLWQLRPPVRHPVPDPSPRAPNVSRTPQRRPPDRRCLAFCPTCAHSDRIWDSPSI